MKSVSRYKVNEFFKANHLYNISSSSDNTLLAYCAVYPIRGSFFSTRKDSINFPRSRLPLLSARVLRRENKPFFFYYYGDLIRQAGIILIRARMIAISLFFFAFSIPSRIRDLPRGSSLCNVAQKKCVSIARRIADIFDDSIENATRRDTLGD